MNVIKGNFLIVIFFMGLVLVSCSTKNNNLGVQIISEDMLYEQGLKQIKTEDYKSAIKIFTELENEYPTSTHYAKILILKAYSFYAEDKYIDALLTVEEFLRQFPTYKDTAYMYYLKSMSNYNQIMDIGRDQEFAILAKKDFEKLIILYPQSKYANDAKWKLEYIYNILAGKEMDIGRFYLRINEPISSVNRFKNIIDSYQTSIFTPEALYRLTEVYFILGIKKEAIKYAIILGYNYPKSIWYKKIYDLLSKNEKA